MPQIQSNVYAYFLRQVFTNQNLMKYPILPALLLLVFITLLPACSSAKKITRTKTVVPENSAAFALVNKLIVNELQADWFNAKAQIEATQGNQKQSFGADIRLKKDSLLWMSAYANLGIKIEVARVLITPDSIKMMDKFNKKYYVKSIRYLETLVGYPLDFNTMQRIILGNKLPASSETPQITNLPEGGYCLSDQTDNLHYAVFVEPLNYTITRLMVTDSINHRNLSVDLSNYLPVSNKPFAHKRTVKMDATDTYTAKIEMSKIKVNEPLEFPFSVGDNYEIIR